MAAVNGPAMLHDLVRSTIGIVNGSVGEQGKAITGLNDQAMASMEAIKNAAAGTITSANYEAHSGQGKVLRDMLALLQEDLAGTQNIMVAGEDEIAGMAKGAAPNGAVFQGMGGRPV